MVDVCPESVQTAYPRQAHLHPAVRLSSTACGRSCVPGKHRFQMRSPDGKIHETCQRYPSIGLWYSTSVCKTLPSVADWRLQGTWESPKPPTVFRPQGNLLRVTIFMRFVCSASNIIGRKTYMHNSTMAVHCHDDRMFQISSGRLVVGACMLNLGLGMLQRGRCTRKATVISTLSQTGIRILLE
jgi:hypothetical protein